MGSLAIAAIQALDGQITDPALKGISEAAIAMTSLPHQTATHCQAFIPAQTSAYPVLQQPSHAPTVIPGPGLVVGQNSMNVYKGVEMPAAVTAGMQRGVVYSGVTFQFGVMA